MIVQVRKLNAQNINDIKSGIYCIVNGITGKIYIGSSLNIFERIKSHLFELKKNSHRNKYLQRSYNKYKENFYYYPIEFCEEKNLLIVEQKWMDLTKCYNDKFGYNIMDKADRKTFSKEHCKNLSISHIGHKHTKETKRKISNHSKARKYPSRYKAVFQYNLSGDFIKEYTSVTEASLLNNFSLVGKRAVQTCISSACKSIKNKTAYNYIWKFKNKDDSKNEYKKLSDNEIKFYKKVRYGRKIISLSDNKIYNSIVEAAKSNNLGVNKIHKDLRKNKNWKYLDENSN